MPAPLSRILPIVVTSMLVVPGARAQSLASRIDGADGTIRLNIPARSGVCGNGTFIGEETATEFRSYTMLSNGFMTSRSEDFQPTCRTGPIRLAMERSAGRCTGCARRWVSSGVRMPR